MLSGNCALLSDLKELPTVQLGDFTLQLEVDDPTSEVLEIARKELRETPDLARESSDALKDLLKGMVYKYNHLHLLL